MNESERGRYNVPLEVRRVGMVTVSVAVNGKLVGLPKTLEVLAGSLASLRPVSEDLIRCTAGEG